MQISPQNLNAMISLGCFPLVSSTLPFLSQSSPNYHSQALPPRSRLVLTRVGDARRWQSGTRTAESSAIQSMPGVTKIIEETRFFLKKTPFPAMSYGIVRSIYQNKDKFTLSASQTAQLSGWKAPSPRGRVTDRADVLD